MEGKYSRHNGMKKGVEKIDLCFFLRCLFFFYRAAAAMGVAASALRGLIPAPAPFAAAILRS